MLRVHLPSHSKILYTFLCTKIFFDDSHYNFWKLSQIDPTHFSYLLLGIFKKKKTITTVNGNHETAFWNFLGGLVVKNLSANGGVINSILGPGTEIPLEPTHPRFCALQPAISMRSPPTATRESPLKATKTQHRQFFL